MQLALRIATLGAFALAIASCSNGAGGALPFAGPPNNNGGTPGTNQPGGNSTALLRFVQGSPDFSAVDVCVDNVPFGATAPTVAYGTASSNLYAVAGGVTHTVAVYPAPTSFVTPGAECPTAPGPYFGEAPIAVTTIQPGTAGNPGRETIALGGTAASGTLGLYVFGDPAFTAPPSGSQAIAHNAAPAFSQSTPNKSVGFGYVPTGGVATNLPGAQSVGAPSASTSTAAVINASVQASIPAPPASFYDGIGVSAGTVVPITSVPAPPAATPYVVALYAIDAAGGGLGLIAVPEQNLNVGY